MSKKDNNRITSEESLAAQSAYEKAEGKQFGNLHERIRYLKDAMLERGFDGVGNEVWNAIWDLETVVERCPPIRIK